MSATPQTMKGRIPRGPIPVLGSISRGLAGVMRRPLLGMAALLSTIVLYVDVRLGYLEPG